MTLNLCPLALVIYTDNLPDGVGGRANAFVVRIRTKFLKDAGILHHELEHVGQWWATLGLHPFLYAVSKRYRLWSEARAYARQLGMYDADRNLTRLDTVAARFARTGYGLGLTQDQAEQAILRYL